MGDKLYHTLGIVPADLMLEMPLSLFLMISIEKGGHCPIAMDLGYDDSCITGCYQGTGCRN